jgi:hypothetical protein
MHTFIPLPATCFRWHLRAAFVGVLRAAVLLLCWMLPAPTCDAPAPSSASFTRRAQQCTAIIAAVHASCTLAYCLDHTHCCYTGPSNSSTACRVNCGAARTCRCRAGLEPSEHSTASRLACSVDGFTYAHSHSTPHNLDRGGCCDAPRAPPAAVLLPLLLLPPCGRKAAR